MNAKTTVITFIVLLGGLALLNLFTPARSFSENENRYLHKFPTFSKESLIDGSYTADIDAFVTDQFAFRDSWVGLKTLSELALQKHTSGGVYFARDGYLIEMFDSITDSQYNKNIQTVADFTKRIQDGTEVEVHTMLVPTASMVLADKLPASAPEVDQAALLVRAANTIPGFVDISGTLQHHTDEYIYYRTDHHWTSLGALYAYEAYCEGLGIDGRTSLQDYEQKVLSDEFYGTTYSKASLYSAKPDTITAYIPQGLALTVEYDQGVITDSIYERSYLELKDKYSVFLNANQPLTRVTTSNPNGKRILVVKDSYANTLVQMLCTDYEEIHVLDLRYYKQSPYEYVQDNAITDVLILYNVKNFSGDTNLYYLST